MKKLTKTEQAKLELNTLENVTVADIMRIMNILDINSGVVFNKLKKEYAVTTTKDIAKGEVKIEISDLSADEVVKLFWESHKNQKLHDNGFDNKKWGSYIKIRRYCAKRIINDNIDMGKFDGFVKKCCEIYSDYEMNLNVSYCEK